jgi:Flp pilus assembly protein TadD
MSRPGKQSQPQAEPAPGPSLTELRELTQVDFELDFYGRILERHPLFFEALRAHASNLAARGRYAESMQVERRIIQIRPADALAHYNLACSYALLRQPDLALVTLRRALELGYHDFRYIRQDRDLDGIRRDPRFKRLIREFEDC